MRLFEIQSEWEALWETIAAQEGELTPEQEAELDDLKLARDEKLLNCNRQLQNLDANLREIKRVMVEMKKQRKRVERDRDKLRDYVAGNLGPGEKWRFGLFTFGWTKATGVEVVVPVSDLAAEYRRVVETANKEALREALEAGEQIPGVRIDTRYHLNWKVKSG